MNLEFGKKVYEKSLELARQGRDANQIAKILFDQDPQGYNYGIGIILKGNGEPSVTSPKLLEYSEAELKNSLAGNYMNSGKMMDDLKRAVLRWQRIPEKYWDSFRLALPSDAGTGAVRTAIDIALMMNPDLNAIGVEELGWPAYRAMAKVARVDLIEFPADEVCPDASILPIYQAGPMNTTGYVQKKENVVARAKAAAESGSLVILDRAYSGFEYCRLLGSSSYDEVMRKSCQLQLEPFMAEGVTFCAAISPTKAFVTFALRPCGLLLIFCPDEGKRDAITAIINTAIRARGSAFEHPTTRAFVRAMINDIESLEKEHEVALSRVSEAESIWREYVKGTPIEYLYSENYAGLFRNPRAKEDAPIHIYNEHLYPVFSNQRCRQNVTGIPDNRELAARHVAIFAQYCY